MVGLRGNWSLVPLIGATSRSLTTCRGSGTPTFVQRKLERQEIRASAATRASRDAVWTSRDAMGPMPLTLVTGPANAAKAGAVLERLRELRDRDPLLVVPTAADVDHYRRELAAEGIVFGAEVVRFRHLIRAIGEAAGVRGRPLRDIARDRVVRAVVRSTPLTALAASAQAPGFVAAVGELFGELQLVTPARFTRALRTWAAAGG